LIERQFSITDELECERSREGFGYRSERKTGVSQDRSWSVYTDAPACDLVDGSIPQPGYLCAW
jgi:hypothetical protein